jgi:hypothetical protein
MFVLIILALIVAWIARVARSRGASPWLFGVVATLGYFVLPIVLAIPIGLLFREQLTHAGVMKIVLEMLLMGAGWLWIGAVALYVSRVPGRSKAQPPGRWTCRGCGYLNEQTALKCEACGEPYPQISATIEAGP